MEPGQEVASMSPRKQYVPPSVVRHNSDSEAPEWNRNLIRSGRPDAADSLSGPQIVSQDYITVVDLDRRYVHVSDDFCKLVGYDRETLIGKRYDDLTAPGTNDILMVFNLFCQLEYMHGLWMLVARSGTRILVRYESWLRPDLLIEGHMQLVGAGY
jgi:PAS domain S-box-containing protein